MTAGRRTPRWMPLLAVLWGAGLVGLGLLVEGIGDRRPVVLIGIGVAAAGLAWLALASLRRHLAAAAAQADRPYMVRHRGLLFAALMGSFSAGWNFRRWHEREISPTLGATIFTLLFLVTIAAPLALWAGGLWQRGFDAGMDVLSGRKDDDARR